jgi:carbon-monoxide dehydrogenase large subunit
LQAAYLAIAMLTCAPLLREQGDTGALTSILCCTPQARVVACRVRVSGLRFLRKEDDRFLRGRGQYVADLRFPGAREVAFVRSSVAHGRIRHVHVPAEHANAVFTANHLTGVNPIRAATALSGFKHSSEPILAIDKVRYVGELVAICVGGSRAEAEDVAASVVVEYEELEPVVDMLAARRPGSALVHEDWGDNVFIEFVHDGAIERVADTAAIKVTRTIRTARHCMFPMEGRGVVAYRDARLGFLTIVSSTQMPHIVQRGVAECLGISDGSIRVISPMWAAGSATRGFSVAKRWRWHGWRCTAERPCAGSRIAAST